MEREWDIVDVIERDEVSHSVFCIFEIVDRNSGISAYTVSDNGDAVGIFESLEDAYKDMYTRMRKRQIAVDSSYTFYD